MFFILNSKMEITSLKFTVYDYNKNHTIKMHVEFRFTYNVSDKLGQSTIVAYIHLLTLSVFMLC